jgi:hypothetical protein
MLNFKEMIKGAIYFKEMLKNDFNLTKEMKKTEANRIYKNVLSEFNDLIDSDNELLEEEFEFDNKFKLAAAIAALKDLQEYDTELNDLLMDNGLSYDRLKEIQIKLEETEAQL